MKKTILAGAVLAALGASINVAHAEDAAAQPEHAVAYNVGVTNDYRFRGISQSQRDPAFSLGADYTHNPSGAYLGVFASTIKWVKDSGGDGNTEVDVYGGKRGQLTDDLGYDVGAIYYYYPGHGLGTAPDANTFEVYGQLGVGPAYLKLNYALTDAFYTSNKAGSYYVDAGANVPVADGLVVNVHAGYYYWKDATDFNYTDWKVGLTKDFGFVTAAIAYVGTNADKTLWNFGNKGFLGNNAGVVTLTKAF